MVLEADAHGKKQFESDDNTVACKEDVDGNWVMVTFHRLDQ